MQGLICQQCSAKPPGLTFVHLHKIAGQSSAVESASHANRMETTKTVTSSMGLVMPDLLRLNLSCDPKARTVIWATETVTDQTVSVFIHQPLCAHCLLLADLWLFLAFICGAGLLCCIFLSLVKQAMPMRSTGFNVSERRNLAQLEQSCNRPP